MKLRTEMVQVDGEMRLALGASPGRYSAREHDAMAAHALLQAMGEACASTWHDYRPSEEITGFIKQRSAEILAGWMGEE